MADHPKHDDISKKRSDAKEMREQQHAFFYAGCCLQGGVSLVVRAADRGVGAATQSLYGGDKRRYRAIRARDNVRI